MTHSQKRRLAGHLRAQRAAAAMRDPGHSSQCLPPPSRRPASIFEVNVPIHRPDEFPVLIGLRGALGHPLMVPVAGPPSNIARSCLARLPTYHFPRSFWAPPPRRTAPLGLAGRGLFCRLYWERLGNEILATDWKRAVARDPKSQNLKI
jgi:hypothetical protein